MCVCVCICVHVYMCVFCNIGLLLIFLFFLEKLGINLDNLISFEKNILWRNILWKLNVQQLKKNPFVFMLLVYLLLNKKPKWTSS